MRWRTLAVVLLVAIGCHSRPRPANQSILGERIIIDKPSRSYNRFHSTSTLLLPSTTIVNQRSHWQSPSFDKYSSRQGWFTATCYDLRGRTASGSLAGPGQVAVDPHVIPLGTSIYVVGVGTLLATDTGEAIKGYRLDIWQSSGCIQFGVKRVFVEWKGYG